MELANKIQEARDSGYSDEEISSFLSGSRADLAPKIKTAIDSGYSHTEVVDFISQSVGTSQQTPTVSEQPQERSILSKYVTGPLWGAAETGASLATGLATQVPKGLAGLGALAGGASPEQAAEVVENLYSKFLQRLEPRSPEGKALTGMAEKVLSVPGKVADKLVQAQMDYQYPEEGRELLAQTIPEADIDLSSMPGTAAITKALIELGLYETGGAAGRGAVGRARGKASILEPTAADLAKAEKIIQRQGVAEAGPGEGLKNMLHRAKQPQGTVGQKIRAIEEKVARQVDDAALDAAPKQGAKHPGALKKTQLDSHTVVWTKDVPRQWEAPSTGLVEAMADEFYGVQPQGAAHPGAQPTPRPVPTTPENVSVLRGGAGEPITVGQVGSGTEHIPLPPAGAGMRATVTPRTPQPVESIFMTRGTTPVEMPTSPVAEAPPAPSTLIRREPVGTSTRGDLNKMGRLRTGEKLRTVEPKPEVPSETPAPPEPTNAGELVAQELKDVTYDGVQELKSGEKLYQFTDKVTESTFYTREPTSTAVLNKLSEVRSKDWSNKKPKAELKEVEQPKETKQSLEDFMVDIMMQREIPLTNEQILAKKESARRLQAKAPVDIKRAQVEKLLDKVESGEITADEALTQVGVDTSTWEPTEAEVNASGESAASLEAQRRVEAEKTKGQKRYRVDTRDPSRVAEVLPTVDAVDLVPQDHEIIVQQGVGKEPLTIIDQGKKVSNAKAKNALNRMGEKPKSAEVPTTPEKAGTHQIIDKDTPASEITDDALLNGKTMGEFKEAVVKGEDLVAEIKDIMKEHGRDAAQDWVNPQKIGARLYDDLVKKEGLSHGDAMAKIREKVAEYEAAYNEAITGKKAKPTAERIDNVFELDEVSRSKSPLTVDEAQDTTVYDYVQKKTVDKLPKKVVELKNLIGLEPFLDTKTLENYRSGRGEKIPIVVQKNGKQYIYDGNHRLAVDLLDGKETAEVAYFNSDSLAERSRLRELVTGKQEPKVAKKPPKPKEPTRTQVKEEKVKAELDEVIEAMSEPNQHETVPVIEDAESAAILAEMGKKGVEGATTDVPKSKGHVMFDGFWEYFELPNGNLYRAPIDNPIDNTGYRQGGRFESTAAGKEARIDTIKNIGKRMRETKLGKKVKVKLPKDNEKFGKKGGKTVVGEIIKDEKYSYVIDTPEGRVTAHKDWVNFVEEAPRAEKPKTTKKKKAPKPVEEPKSLEAQADELLKKDKKTKAAPGDTPGVMKVSLEALKSKELRRFLEVMEEDVDWSKTSKDEMLSHIQELYAQGERIMPITSELYEYMRGRAEGQVLYEDAAKVADAMKGHSVTMDFLGLQTGYESIANSVRNLKVKAEEYSVAKAKKYKDSIHKSALAIWGKNYKGEYAKFKKALFGEDVSAAKLSINDLKKLDIALERAKRKYSPKIYKKGTVVRHKVAPKGKDFFGEGKHLMRPEVKGADANVMRGIKELDEMFLRKWTKSTEAGIGLLETPIRIFEELGQPVKELFYDKIADADKAAAFEAKAIADKLDAITKGMTKAQEQKIYKYAISKQKDGVKILTKMGEEIPKTLTPEEMKIYQHMRKEFESAYKRLNKARIEAGVVPFKKVENYFTFWNALSEMMESTPLTSIDAFKLETKMRETPFRFKKRRKGSNKLVLDGFSIYKEYMKSAMNHIHKTPHLGRMRELLEKFDDGFKLSNKAPNTHNFLADWVNSAAGIPKLADVKPIQKMISKLQENLTFSVLAYNLRSILVQPTAMVSTVTEIGAKWSKVGVEALFDADKHAFIDANSNVITRDFDVHAADVLKGLDSNLRKKVGKAGLAWLQWADKQTAKATWYGAFEKARAEGMNKVEAIRYADDTVVKTQASARPHDLAKIQKSVLGKAATLFQTFVINHFDFIRRDILGINNPNISRMEVGKKFMRWMVGMQLVNFLFEDVLDIPSPFPAPFRRLYEYSDEGVDKALLEAAKETLDVVPLLSSMRYGSSIGGPIVQIGQEAADIISDKPGPKRKAVGVVGRVSGLPGAAQIEKAVKRMSWGQDLLSALIGSGTKPEKKKGGRQRGNRSILRKREGR